MLRTKIVFLYIVLFVSLNVSAQYVTIKGKQFYDGNGIPFFPMLANWSAELVYNSMANTYYLSTNHSDGPDNYFDCNNDPTCDAQMLAEFNYLANHGFNGIRLADLYPEDVDNASLGGFQGLVFRTLDPTTLPDWTRGYLNMSQPYTSGNAIKLFNAYQKVLDIASQVTKQPFYVIINTWGTRNEVSDPSVPNGKKLLPWGDIQPYYVAFLNEMGNRFNSNSNLLAYDFYNEPCYGFVEEYSKEDVCALTSGWYNAIKLNDAHHLATLGNCWDGGKNFDPAIVKVDFMSPHLYSEARLFNYTDNNSGAYLSTQSTKADYEDRIKGILYWINKTYPMPWIVGETGFTASSSYSYNDFLDGSLADQRDYADFSVHKTVDCEGSGYSWWNYQDNYNSSQGTPGFGGNFFGLLERGISTCPTPFYVCSDMDKPVTTFFSGYTPSAPVSGNCPLPPNYYDPYHIASLSTTLQYTITGHLEDQNGNPMENAYIGAWNYTYDKKIGPSKYEPQNFYHYTFSDPNGNFTIIPYDYVGAIDGKWFDAIRINTGGSKAYNVNWCVPNSICVSGYNYLQTNLVHSPVLDRQFFAYDENLSNIDLLTGSNSVNFKGWNSLTVNNMIAEGNGTNGAIANLTAREEVHLNTEFNAQKGSEVHVYTSTTLPECTDYTGYRMTSLAMANDDTQQPREKNLELSFKSVNPINLKIMPNPTKGNCKVIIDGIDHFSGDLTIKDIAGRNIITQKMNNLTEELNLSHLAEGVYYLQVSDNNKISLNKIIIIN